VLVALEVALSLVLMIGAGLLAASFARLQRVDPGFAPDHVLSASVSLPIPGRLDPIADGPRWSAFFGQLVARVNALPGVRAAGAVSTLPLTGLLESGGFTIEGRPKPERGRSPSADYLVIEGRYFRAMGIGVAEGRAFDSRDRADGVPAVIVNRAFVREHFPGEPALGRRIVPGFDFTGAPRTIVGIVEDAKQTSLDAEPRAAMYVPEAQMAYPFLAIVARTDGEPRALLPALRRELAALDPKLALADVRTMDEVFAESLARQRFSTTVLVAFALSALLLALVGLYGVIALSVGQRTREIGVRTALGARPRDLLTLVLGEGVRITAIGLALGIVVALGVTRVLGALLYGVSVTEWSIYAACAVLVAVVATVATVVPARRAMRVSPTEAMRAE
jgi:putative ABC transport system permease protein